jgi:hypothetical protein
MLEFTDGVSIVMCGCGRYKHDGGSEPVRFSRYTVRMPAGALDERTCDPLILVFLFIVLSVCDHWRNRFRLLNPTLDLLQGRYTSNQTFLLIRFDDRRVEVVRVSVA